jgi:hypothetical protein
MYDQVVLIFCWQLSKTFRIYSRYHWNLIPLNDYLVEYLLQGISPPKQLLKSIVYGAVNETYSNEWSLRTTSDNDFLRIRDIHGSVELASVWKYAKSSRILKIIFVLWNLWLTSQITLKAYVLYVTDIFLTYLFMLCPTIG